MLSRSIVQRTSALMMGITGVSIKKLPVFAMASSLQMPCRGIMTVIDGDEAEHVADMKLKNFSFKSIFMGSERYPGYKRVS